MNKLFEAWQSHTDKRKQNALQMRVNTIRSEFQVCERNGKLYLVNYDTAFEEISPDATAEEIVKLLFQARAAAEEFEKNKQ